MYLSMYVVTYNNIATILFIHSFNYFKNFHFLCDIQHASMMPPLFYLSYPAFAWKANVLETPADDIWKIKLN